MGADFIFGYVSWKAGTTSKEEEENRANRFDSIRNIINNFTVECCEFIVEQRGMGGEDITDEEIADLKEELLATTGILEEASLGSREVGFIHHKGDVIMISGGLSYGDTPTRVTDCIFQLSEAGLL